MTEARPALQPLRPVQRRDTGGAIGQPRRSSEQPRSKARARTGVKQIEPGASVGWHALLESLGPGSQVNVAGPQVRGQARRDRASCGLAAVHEYEPVAVAYDQGGSGFQSSLRLFHNPE